MSNHQRGMHSRIRPACSYYFNFATQKGRQCLHQTFLHTNPIRLNLPTVIVGSVVSQINKIPLHANSSFLGFSRAKVVILSHLSLYNSHKPVYLENLIIALVTTGIFVIQFVLSIFFGDIDADVDVDADISSVVSFKGLTHFGIGFGWYMYLAGNTEIQSYVIGILVGLFFVLAVWFLYKKAYQLQQVNHSEQTDQLVGRECTIYFKQSDSKYTVQTTRDGAMREVDVISESGKTYQTGDRTIITSYKDGTLFIQ